MRNLCFAVLQTHEYVTDTTGLVLSYYVCLESRMKVSHCHFLVKGIP